MYPEGRRGSFIKSWVFPCAHFWSMSTFLFDPDWFMGGKSASCGCCNGVDDDGFGFWIVNMRVIRYLRVCLNMRVVHS